MVMMLVGVGATAEEVGTAIKLKTSQLYHHYGKELRDGKRRITLRIASGVAQRAIDGDNACAFFYLKAQAGWREKSEIEHSFKGTAEDLTDEQLTRIIEGRGRRIAGPAESED